MVSVLAKELRTMMGFVGGVDVAQFRCESNSSSGKDSGPERGGDL